MSKRKKIILVIVSIIGIVLFSVIAYLAVAIPKAQRAAIHMARCGQLNHIYSIMTYYSPLLTGTENEPELPSEALNNNPLPPLKPNMWDPQNEKMVSWRKWVIDFGYYRESSQEEIAQGDDEAASLYCAIGQQEKGQTNFVFITGEKTIHHFDINQVQKVFDDTFDKILMMEYPFDNIPWDSLHDISVADACALWRKARDKHEGWRNEIAYITLQGHYGRISRFETEADLMDMLVFTDSEIEKYNASNPEKIDEEANTDTAE